MYRVGLTGGIGSGKSTVANLFARHSITVIDTDLIAHQITQPDGPAYQAIIDAFGEDIICPDRTIDRKKLANIIFHSKDKKTQLESILHPLIWLIVEQQILASHSPYCIVVVPLLFEGEHQSRFNSTLLVQCSEEEQIKRVTKRDQRSIDDIKAIMDNQLATSKKLKLADNVITNSGSIDTLETEVQRLHKTYIEQATRLAL